MGWPTRLITRARAVGVENVPATGGAVYAINHLHWIDIPLVGLLSPRTVWFVAKAEAAKSPVFGPSCGVHGAIAIRRGESDRDAVRHMREAARAGNIVGLFVEGTRQRNGRPGVAQPGAAMVALQEDVPVVPVAVYGTQFWSSATSAAARSRSASRSASTACRRTARATARRRPRSSAGSTSSSTSWNGGSSEARRDRRDRRLPERRQVDARSTASPRRARPSSTRRRARRATARSSSASGTGSSSC